MNQWRNDEKQPIMKPKVEMKKMLQTMEVKAHLVLLLRRIKLLNFSSDMAGVIYLVNVRTKGVWSQDGKIKVDDEHETKLAFQPKDIEDEEYTAHEKLLVSRRAFNAKVKECATE